MVDRDYYCSHCGARIEENFSESFCDELCQQLGEMAPEIDKLTQEIEIDLDTIEDAVSALRDSMLEQFVHPKVQQVVDKIGVPIRVVTGTAGFVAWDGELRDREVRCYDTPFEEFLLLLPDILGSANLKPKKR